MTESINFDPPMQSQPHPIRRKLGLRLSVHYNASGDTDSVPRSAILVNQAIIGEAGYQAGVRDGDVILEVDGIHVDNLRGNSPDLLEAFSSFIRTNEIGEVIVLSIKRKDELVTIKVKM